MRFDLCCHGMGNTFICMSDEFIDYSDIQEDEEDYYED